MSIGLDINKEQLREKALNLPDTPGVYMFLDAKGTILYIGKATSLKDRVKSYFGDDLMETRGRRLVDMMALSTDITTISTLSVLEALILEANLIQKHEPKYNAIQKDNKSWNFVVISKEHFPKIFTIRERTLESTYPKKDIKYSFGPFTNGNQLRDALKIIRKIFPYRDEKCVTAEEQINAGKIPHPCFNRQILLCPGTCTGEISKEDYAKTINHIRLFFEGKKTELVKSLEKEMNAYAKNQEFEKAEQSKRQIFALDHINDVALIRPEEDTPDDFRYVNEETGNFRIEAYDIAHLGGFNTVGVMTVVENGEMVRSQYRKFKIKKLVGKVNDPQNLKEVLERRFKHGEWQMPQLIVVDGNEIQINAAKEVLKEHELDIDVVSVVKDSRHKAREIIGAQNILEQHEKAILLANSEAHRFAIAYHRLLRQRRFKV